MIEFWNTEMIESWNDEMIECWNVGLKETSSQNAYYFIDYLVLTEYFSGKTR